MTNCSNAPGASELPQRLRRIRHVALDMDGTIYMGDTLFPWTIPFLKQLKQMGIGYTFLTNNSSRSTTDYLDKLAAIGIRTAREEIYTTVGATVDYLRSRYPGIGRLFVLGTPGAVREFEENGFVVTGDDPDDVPHAVVVAFDTTLDYPQLCRAAWWVSRGLPYLATNPDRVCPTDERVVLVDCGSICKSIEEATGRRPDAVVGKPDPRMLQGILARHGLRPDEVAVVGDRIYTDVALARNAHALGVLVLSGETTREAAAEADIPPDITLRDLGEFGALLCEAHRPASAIGTPEKTCLIL